MFELVEIHKCDGVATAASPATVLPFKRFTKKNLLPPGEDLEPGVDLDPDPDPEPGSVLKIPELNTDEIYLFFEFVHRHAASLGAVGELVLSSFGSDPDIKDIKKAGIPQKIRRFKVGHAKEMHGAALQWSKDMHRNVYLQLTTHIGLKGNQRVGRSENFEMAIGCVADFDLKHDPSAWQSRAPLPPDAVVKTSGENRQLYWFYTRGVGDRDEAALICEALRDRCQCDSGTITPEHAWRVPGGRNWPNYTKVHDLKRSRNPELSECLVSPGNKFTDPYDLKKALAPEISAIKSKKKTSPVINPDELDSINKGLFLNPNAMPPQPLWDTMCINHEDEVKLLWELLRQDFNDKPDSTGKKILPNPSKYDLAWVNRLVRVGFSDQQILDCLMYFRREKGFDQLLHNKQKFTRTIFKVRAEIQAKRVEQLNEDIDNADFDPNATKAEVAEKAREVLAKVYLNGMKILRFIQIGRQNTKYMLYTNLSPDPAIINSPLALENCLQFRTAISGQFAHHIEHMSPTKWSKAVGLMYKMVELQTDADDHFVAEILGIMSEYIASRYDNDSGFDIDAVLAQPANSQGKETLIGEFAINGHPFKLDNCYWVHPGYFDTWLKLSGYMFHKDRSDLTAKLRICGFKKVDPIKFLNPFTENRSSKRYYPIRADKIDRYLKPLLSE